MKILDILALLSGVLQPGLAGYALRLNRVFGIQRVGWWVFCAFISLALLQASRLLQPAGTAFGLIDLPILLLLLAGMVTAEKVWRGNLQSERTEANFKGKLELITRDAESLRSLNRDLMEQALRREERESALKLSEEQFRSLFLDNPLAMWVFDLRTLRLLAVNHAALRLYGLGSGDLSGLTARQLHADSDMAAFVQDCARPSVSLEHARLWRHRCRDGGLLHVEVNQADLRFEGCPARVIVARPL